MKNHYKQLEEELLKKYKALWTNWIPIDNNKMRKIENKPAKGLVKLLIADAYLGGLSKGEEIIKAKGR